MGTLTQEDLRTFERYCRTYALWQKMAAAMDEQPIVVETDVRALASLDASLRKLEASFGKTPADRANMKLPDTPKADASDPFKKPKLRVA